MKKRFGAILLAGVMACGMTAGVALTTGCGRKPIPEFEMPEGGYDGRAVEITFANTTGQNLATVVDDAIKRFNVLYPNIKVTVDNTTKSWDDFADNIAKKITTDRHPDVAFCYSDHVALYNQSKAVLALDDFLPDGAYADMEVTHADGVTEPLGLTEEQKNDYFAEFYKEGSIYGDGKTYTLPFAKSTEVLFYNKTFFDKNNLEVPATWEDVEKVCKKILELDPKCNSALGYDSEANLFITMCEQLGSPYTVLEGDHFQFDNAKNREFVQKVKGWYDNRYIRTKETNDGKYSSNFFKEQQMYMSIGSTGGSSYQSPTGTDGNAGFEVGVAPLPQWNAESPKTILQGPSICIFKKDPYKVLASWLLVKFLTTEVRFQAQYSMTSGYAPVTQSTYNSAEYQKFISTAGGTASGLTALTAKICKEMADKPGSFYVSPAFMGSSKAREAVGILLKTVLQGTSMDKAFSDALQECKYAAGQK
ncbi:MAG: extracellular solute-binding protein [Clostridia bacterium]|nr:extracellular solute-binding protein [Clostridia bacterium]